MDGETGEGSTMEGDTISSASSVDSMSLPNEQMDHPPVCTKGDGVDLEGVAIESIRAIGLSAWLVTETLMAVGTEIVRIQGSCGVDNSIETSQRNGRFVDIDQQNRSPRRAQSRRTGKGDTGDNDDESSSVISYPPSKKKKKRRKGRFSFLGGLSNRAKKNFQAGLPPTIVTTDGTSEFPSVTLQRKVPPKKPAIAKVQPKAPVLKDPPKPKVNDPPRWQGRSGEHSPARAKKLLTGCFVKKHVEDDMTEQSRYQTDHEDLELVGEQAVYTIRLSRVQSSEYEDLL